MIYKLAMVERPTGMRNSVPICQFIDMLEELRKKHPRASIKSIKQEPSKTTFNDIIEIVLVEEQRNPKPHKDFKISNKCKEANKKGYIWI